MDREPTRDDVDALVGPATPHFAFQIRARVRELVDGLPADHEVRRYADAQMQRLDDLGLRLVEGGRRPARVARPHRLGRDSLVGAGGQAASAPAVNVFVTGGSRGIGRAIALRFARDGAERIAIGYLRNDRAAEETADELRALGAEVVLVRGNVTSDRVLGEVAALGPLDVLVHNAATGVIRPALETEDKHWDWTMNANARALLQLARAAAPQMTDGSSIVAISSLGAQRVLENYVLIGTSKAALEALVRYLSVELAPRIRVNAVSGGVVDTGALEHFPNRDEMLAAGAANPVGRLVTPDDIAARSRSSARRTRHDPRPDADRRRRLLAARRHAQAIATPPSAHRAGRRASQQPGSTWRRYDSRMNPWRAALTSATASGNSTRIASRIAIDCSSAPPSTWTCESAAAVSSTAVLRVSVANCSRCASCTDSACCSANSRNPRRRSSGSPPNGNPNPPSDMRPS